MYLRSTQLEMGLMCGLKYKFAVIDKIFRPDWINMKQGTCVHRSSEEDARTKIRDGVWLPLEDVKMIASQALKDEWEKGVMLKPDEKTVGDANLRGQAEDRVVALAACHHTDVAPNLEPEYVEREWAVTTPDGNTVIAGRMDIQESKVKRNRIHDIKTSKTKPAKNVEHLSPQMTIYSMASKVLDGVTAPITLDYLVGTKTKTYWEPRETTRDENDWNAVLWRINQFASMVEAGIFLPAPLISWWCDPFQCQFWDICPSVNNKRSYFV